jgi:hypothetical protein
MDTIAAPENGTEGNVIKGLYAVGEIVGGLFFGD